MSLVFYINSILFIQELPAKRRKDDANTKWPSIIIAIQRNDVPWVEKYINGGKDVNRSQHGSLPLHEACKVRNLAMVDMLIRAGARIDQIDGDKNMPLNLAAEFGCVKMVKRILQENPSKEVINNENRKIESPAVSATIRGEPEIVKLLVESGDINVSEGPLLLKACNVGNLAIVDMLIEAGAKIDQIDCHQNMPLNLAAKHGNVEIVKRILQENPSNDLINNKDLNGLTALSSAIDHPTDNLAIVDMLIEAGARIDQIDCHQNMPLNLAAKHGYVEIVKRILQENPSNDLINNKNSDGSTALSAAIEYRSDIAIVDMLIEAGARIDQIDCHQNMPLNLAAKHGYVEIVKRILRENPSEDIINNKGSDGLTALTAAINYRTDDFMHIDDINTACIKILLQAGCNANANDTDEEITPLLAAAEKSHTNEILKELLLVGADVRSKYSDGLNVLQKALQYRCGPPRYQTGIYDGHAVDVHRVHRKYKKMTEFKESCTMLVNLLYAAGVTAEKVIDTAETDKRDTAPEPWLQILYTERNAELSLLNICRQQIRSYILSPYGGNQANLLIAIPKLRLPAKLQDFLLYHVDITEIRDIEPQIDDICRDCLIYEYDDEYSDYEYQDDDAFQGIYHDCFGHAHPVGTGPGPF